MKRRTFIKTLFGAVVALPLMKLPRAFAADKAACGPSDPVASAIGYVADGKKADTAKYPQAKGKAGISQTCDNCALMPKPAVNGMGDCQMLSNCKVAAKGWCGSWSKKA